MSQPTPDALHVDSHDLSGAEPQNKMEVIASFIAKSEAQQLVYGVVLQPDLVDSQGDEVDAVEIEKAAHDYLVDFRLNDVQHSEDDAPVDVVESYIAPVDFELGDQPVAKGSWVMVLKVHDPQIWDDIQKDELTGLSIGGSAIRVNE